MENDNQEGGVNINNAKSVIVHGDMVGHDKITYLSEQEQLNFLEAITLWQTIVENEIDKTKLPKDEKSDIKRQVDVIKSALVTDKANKPSRLEKLINAVFAMSPDIFDVIIATLANPLAGIGLVIKKIGDKAKIESKV